MAARVELTGQTFGRLEVLGYAGNSRPHNKGRACWLCVCECDEWTVVRGTDLTRGLVRSCGCLRREVTRKRATTHGQTCGGEWTRSYRAWVNMIQRCTNPNVPDYHLYYGGQGIVVCDRWLHSYENFYEDMGDCADDLTLDRVDPYGNYEPGNCRWASAREQRWNQRRMQGREMPI